MTDTRRKKWFYDSDSQQMVLLDADGTVLDVRDPSKDPAYATNDTRTARGGRRSDRRARREAATSAAMLAGAVAPIPGARVVTLAAAMGRSIAEKKKKSRRRNVQDVLS